jgi:thioredoxin-like negative regulator of GroEL
MSDLDTHARAGMQAIGERRIEDAIQSFTKAVELDPSRPDLTHLLGKAYMARGEVGSAIPYLERAVALAEPFDAPEHQPLKRQFHLGLASAHQLADQVPEAVRVLRGALRRWPDALDAQLQLGALLLNACELEDGVELYRALLGSALPKEQREPLEALVGAIDAFRKAEDLDADVFLEAHRDSYAEYFDSVAAQQEAEGWFAEAARMARPEREGDDPKPYLAEGARPYALTRVDLVNPADGKVASIYSDTEPMIVVVEGLEPLAQAPVMLPWRGWPFEVWVSSQCPWHWLTITLQFQAASTPEQRAEAVDGLIGEWYLSGYNGDFGESNRGRFHYITDPMEVGDRGISYVVDLGRSKFEAVGALLKRLVILHDRKPLRRVLFGAGHLPD